MLALCIITGTAKVLIIKLKLIKLKFKVRKGYVRVIKLSISCSTEEATLKCKDVDSLHSLRTKMCQRMCHSSSFNNSIYNFSTKLVLQLLYIYFVHH